MDIDIQKAINILKENRVVSIPTETVYGLAANASSELAVNKVFEIKDRPKTNPLIVHIANKEKLDFWAQNIPKAARLLAEKFWPGPLTLILEKKSHVLSQVTANQKTVALRVPDHILTLELLKNFDGLVAPSANRYGRISPTCAEDVYLELGKNVDFILDGGRCKLGIESTIVGFDGEEPKILRQGSLSEKNIADYLNLDIYKLENKKNQQKVVTPGSAKSHYAPITKTYLIDKKQIINLCKENFNIAVLGFNRDLLSIVDNNNLILEAEDAISYAKNLYSNLRKLDSLGIDKIFIEQSVDTSEWKAIKDRLARATFDYN